MPLDEYQQAHNLLGNAKSVLIVAGGKEIDDAYPAGLALKTVLQKTNKTVSLFAAGPPPEKLSFLSGDENSSKAGGINGTRELVISINETHKPIKQISYKREGALLNIYVTPEENSQVAEQDIHISMAKFSYDLVVTLGLEELVELRGEFERNAQLFYETPVVNIDSRPSNERYGEVNIVDPTTSSCSEIATKLIRAWDEALVEKKTATCLLAGIIAATNNFQNARTKPNTLYEAAYLMDREAKQQEIIKYLFKTKPLSVLKLCGAALAKLEQDESTLLSWLTLTKQDFADLANTDQESIAAVAAEIKNSLGHNASLVLFWEDNDFLRGIAQASQEEKVRALYKALGGERRGNSVIFAISPEDENGQKKVIKNAVSALNGFNI